tara:strand:+ start:1939 stop:2817 length:879 start_codon:yes stop_codon:yes gene_type:complete
MGLGTVNNKKGLFLSIAGGYIWNRKAEDTDPNYNEQKFSRADGTEGVRAGARYSDLTGRVESVLFRTHDDFGENINVTVASGGERYILSVSTNNRYSQDLMKVLLKMNLTKDIFIKPYDFIGNDKRRAQGISFRQDGEKINLRNEDAPGKEGDWFKTASKKDIKRYFEDLSDWFVAEVSAKIIPALDSVAPIEAQPQGLGNTSEDVFDGAEAPTVKATPVVSTAGVSTLAMKKALKSYITENYEGQSLPKLSKEELVVWYDLSQAEEELPFASDSSEVASNELDAQMDALLG